MQDKKDSSLDADEVRRGMQSAVKRIRQKFVDGPSQATDPTHEAEETVGSEDKGAEESR
jgi:hypothetical protein